MDNKYKIVDSHAHYDDEVFNEDRDELIKELNESGVIGILNCSSSYESIAKTCDLINKWNFIYGAVGIHPENAQEFTEEREIEICKVIKNNSKIIAVGEIGLDYYWDENPSRELQKDVFRRQMKIAQGEQLTCCNTR